MTSSQVDDLTKILSNTFVGEGGVSFQGKSLKLDTEDDAIDIIHAINNCTNLEYLNLEGNTLGVGAAKAVSKALEAHSEFKRALWKDLFTGRMKTEIPKALHFLGSGLVLAGARLSELDLSDNAFGPIGVEGLAVLLRSSSCYALQVLKLNNNGLGITGGRLLSKALLDCYQSSKAEGHPLALRVFIAGRNRLENEGAKALSEVFKVIGSLEELSMPQNGIYHVGITALSEALMMNPNLRVMNFNDNTMTVKGVAALVKALPVLQNLSEINLGDCLLKTDGAELLATALADGHLGLEDVNLGFNEIKLKGGLALVESLGNKPQLKNLLLDGNQFGETGREELMSRMSNISKLDILGSLSENEEEDSEEDDGHAESEESESDESDKEEEDEPVLPTKPAQDPQLLVKAVQNGVSSPKNVPVVMIGIADFLHSPTATNFSSLGNSREMKLLAEVQKHEGDPSYLPLLLELLMKVSSLSECAEVQQDVLICTNKLYQTLISWTRTRTEQERALCTNELMIHLGLMKSEDKKKLTWNTDSCLVALHHAVNEDFFPESLKEMLNVFLKRQEGESDDEVQILTPPIK